MKRIRIYCVYAFTVLLFATSCTNAEKEDVSPNKEGDASIERMASCTLQTGSRNLIVEPVGPEITAYLNCLLEDQPVCYSSISQTVSSSTVNIYPGLIWQGNIWEGSYNDQDAVAAAQLVAIDGLSQLTLPPGASSAYIKSYSVVDNEKLRSPWTFELNVTVEYGFCTPKGPGNGLLPADTTGIN